MKPIKAGIKNSKPAKLKLLIKLKSKPNPLKFDYTLKLSLTIDPLYRNTVVDNLLRVDNAGEICLIEVDDSPAIWSRKIS